MRALVQRVKKAAVKTEGRSIVEIGRGLLLLLGVGKEDGQEDVEYLYPKKTSTQV